MAAVKRTLSPALNPTGLGSAAAAIYAAVVMVWNAAHHHAAIDPQVVLAALGAAAFLYARFKVTPLGDPRDGNGAPLATPAIVAAAVAQATAPALNLRGPDAAPPSTGPLEGPPHP
jgi:hypothetical protein